MQVVYVSWLWLVLVPVPSMDPFQYVSDICARWKVWEWGMRLGYDEIINIEKEGPLPPPPTPVLSRATLIST